MKRVDLVRKIEELGCELVRHGAKHDWGITILERKYIKLCHAIEKLTNDWRARILRMLGDASRSNEPEG